jgi:hypothetical protein
LKSPLQRYGLLTVSLGLLFASGLYTGFQWGRHSAPETVAGLSPGSESTPLTAAQWGENAASALQRDLGLTPAQTESVRRTLAGPSKEIFEEKHQGNFKIHLRLLEAHDTLAANADLTDKQKAILKTRREQLRQHILQKFRDIIGEKPDPILSRS